MKNSPNSTTAEPPRTWLPQGELRFDEFMRLALFDEDHGYYRRKIQTVGAKGDFSTSTTLSPALGKSIAAWIAHYHRIHHGPWHLIEIGAGSGKLASTILKALPWLQRWKMHYHIVETSISLKAVQRQHLGSRVKWHDTPAEALEACNGKALIFSNELVDAFPVRIFQRTESSWDELFVQVGPHGIKQELWKSPDKLPISTAFEAPHPVGQRIEIFESFYHWWHLWLPSWREGEMLTIDYGDTCPELYRGRKSGTIRAYSLHQYLKGFDIYQNPGRQDLTADVNFSDLKLWGDDLGLEVLDYRLQSDWIRPFASDSLADQFLLDASGAGREFKVLRHQRTPSHSS